MRSLLFGVLTLLAFCTSCKKESLNPLDPSTESAKSESDSKMVNDYMELVNARRLELGLNELVLVDDLSSVAEVHSQNMASGKVSFGHTGFTDRCNQARDIMGGGNLCGEIVANGQDTAREVFNSWMGSSGHRQKIEEGRYTHTGVAFAKNSNGNLYWTQVFLEVN